MVPVMESMRVAADGLAATAAAGERPVRIGVITAAVPGIVSPAIPALRRQGLRAEFVEESIDRQMELLANGSWSEDRSDGGIEITVVVCPDGSF